MVKCEIELRKVTSQKDSKEYTNYILHLGDFEIAIKPAFENDRSLFKALLKKANTK